VQAISFEFDLILFLAPTYCLLIFPFHTDGLRKQPGSRYPRHLPYTLAHAQHMCKQPQRVNWCAQP
jgi:hypothetical protein